MAPDDQHLTVNPAGSPKIEGFGDDSDEFQRFEEATKRLFKVSKRDLEKAELRKRKEREAQEADKAK